jgi:hypothetical protein
VKNAAGSAKATKTVTISTPKIPLLPLKHQLLQELR